MHVPRQLRRLPCCPALEMIGIKLKIVIGKLIRLKELDLVLAYNQELVLAKLLVNHKKRNKKLTKKPEQIFHASI